MDMLAISSILVLIGMLITTWVLIGPLPKWLDKKVNPYKYRKTYFLSRACSKLGYMPKITCNICNRTSYHPKDVENLYCGYCHTFHKR